MFTPVSSPQSPFSVDDLLRGLLSKPYVPGGSTPLGNIFRDIVQPSLIPRAGTRAAERAARRAAARALGRAAFQAATGGKASLVLDIVQALALDLGERDPSKGRKPRRLSPYGPRGVYSTRTGLAGPGFAIWNTSPTYVGASYTFGAHTARWSLLYQSNGYAHTYGNPGFLLGNPVWYRDGTVSLAKPFGSNPVPAFEQAVYDRRHGRRKIPDPGIRFNARLPSLPPVPQAFLVPPGQPPVRDSRFSGRPGRRVEERKFLSSPMLIRSFAALELASEMRDALDLLLRHLGIRGGSVSDRLIRLDEADVSGFDLPEFLADLAIMWVIDSIVGRTVFRSGPRRFRHTRLALLNAMRAGGI